MIEINLLPEDLKRSAQASDSRRPIILAAFLLVVAAIGVGYFHVAHLAPRLSEKTRLTRDLARLKEDTKQLPVLESSVKHIERRKRSLGDLYTRRIVWSQKLDQLVDIVPTNIWWKSVKLTPPRRSRTSDASGGILAFECFSAGEDEKGITLFYDRLKANSDFWKDIEKASRPYFTLRAFDEYIEKAALEFTLELDLKARKTPGVESGAPARGRTTPRTARGPA